MQDKGKLRTRGPRSLDSIVVGYYRGNELKIRDEQVQLPEETANVLVILTPDVFFRAGGLSRVAREVEDGVFKYDQVHLVILHGEYIGESEGPSTCEVGEHRYTRRIVDGFAEHDLILVNRHSQKKLSENLFSKFFRSF